MQRIGRLLQASMFLNYMWQKMRVAGAPSRWGGKPRGRVIAETTIHIAETSKPAAHGPVLGVWSSSTEHELHDTDGDSVLSASLCLFYSTVEATVWLMCNNAVSPVEVTGTATWLWFFSYKGGCVIIFSQPHSWPFNSWLVAILPLLWWHSDFPHGRCPDIWICTLKPHMQDDLCK